MHRVPLLIWAILLSLDNIITPWVGARYRSQLAFFVCLVGCLFFYLLLLVLRMSTRRLRATQIMFHGGEDTIGKRTKWERVLPASVTQTDDRPSR